MRAWVLAQTEAVHPQYFPLSVTALKSIPKSYCLSYHNITNITFPLICPVYFNTFYIVSAKSHGSEFCDLNTYFISFVCSLFLEPSFLIILSISQSDARKNGWFLLSIHFLYTFTLLQCNSHYCFFFFICQTEGFISLHTEATFFWLGRLTLSAHSHVFLSSSCAIIIPRQSIWYSTKLSRYRCAYWLMC